MDAVWRPQKIWRTLEDLEEEEEAAMARIWPKCVEEQKWWESGLSASSFKSVRSWKTGGCSCSTMTMRSFTTALPSLKFWPGTTSLRSPAYSPDLAPSVFSLFLRMKMKGQRFADIQRCKGLRTGFWRAFQKKTSRGRTSSGNLVGSGVCSGGILRRILDRWKKNLQ